MEIKLCKLFNLYKHKIQLIIIIKIGGRYYYRLMENNNWVFFFKLYV